jgi:DNA-binding response OmpR family regulator
MSSEKVVLVIDPSGVIRQKIAEIVRSVGYKPLLSADGQDAFSKLDSQEQKIDLILTEWFLPKVGGLDFLVKLKESEHKGTPLVFISNNSDKKSVVKALKGGASDYVVKPFSVDQIKQKIKHLVS